MLPHLDTYDDELVDRKIFRSLETGEVYGWMARAARRMAYSDPARLRIEVGRVLRDQGFGLQ
jgi:hypothetical protein